MPSEAFVLKNGKKYGPFSPSQLKELAVAGEIGPEDLVKRDQESLPVPARTISGLADVFNRAHQRTTSPAEPNKSPDWVSEVLSPETEVSPKATDRQETEARVEDRPESTGDGSKPKSEQVPKIAAPRAPASTATYSQPKWLTTERVPANFDPYHIWLGIPKGKRPPTHYQLLRIATGEHADEVIEAAAERQAEYVRKCRIGEYATLADRLLYEIEEAKHCLLNPRLRKDYDEKLEPKQKRVTKTKPIPPSAVSKPVGEGTEIVRTYFGVMSVIIGGFIVMLIVTFMLPWKKVVFSKTDPAKHVTEVNVASEVDQSEVVAANVVNAPQNQVAAGKNPRPGVANQPAALVANKQPMNPAKGRLVALFEEPRPALLKAPFNEVTAKQAQRRWAAHLKIPVQLTNSIGMKLALIPPGEFMMGSDDPNAPENERPQHRVRINRPFFLGVYEVTQEEFQKVMGVNPSKSTGDPRLPVEQVTWDQGQDFLHKLSELRDEKTAARTYRLPSEAEWEYACRAGTQTRTYLGDSISSDQSNFNGEHSDENGSPGINRHGPVMVGSFKPNAWGLFDMYGNVSEGVSDWYSETYYSESPVDDPTGPPSGTSGIARGGSWADWGCRSAMRDSGPRSGVYPNVGFRVVCDLRVTGGASNEAQPKPQQSPSSQPVIQRGGRSGL